MPRGATITDTQTTPPKTASASEQAENSSKLERPHPPVLSGTAPRPQIVGSQCRKLGWIECAAYPPTTPKKARPRRGQQWSSAAADFCPSVLLGRPRPSTSTARSRAHDRG